MKEALGASSYEWIFMVLFSWRASPRVTRSAQMKLLDAYFRTSSSIPFCFLSSLRSIITERSINREIIVGPASHVMYHHALHVPAFVQMILHFPRNASVRAFLYMEKKKDIFLNRSEWDMCERISVTSSFIVRWCPPHPSGNPSPRTCLETSDIFLEIIYLCCMKWNL